MTPLFIGGAPILPLEIYTRYFTLSKYPSLIVLDSIWRDKTKILTNNNIWRNIPYIYYIYGIKQK